MMECVADTFGFVIFTYSVKRKTSFVLAIKNLTEYHWGCKPMLYLLCAVLFSYCTFFYFLKCIQFKSLNINSYTFVYRGDQVFVCSHFLQCYLKSTALYVKIEEYIPSFVVNDL